MNEDVIKNNPESTKYQYQYVELEEVIANPEEFIIPQCIPACKSVWEKNIETYMVSNNEHGTENLYVLFKNLSDENLTIIKKLSETDPRFFYYEYRKKWGIRVKGNDEQASNELKSLVSVLKIQDTLRFETPDKFLESYKNTESMKNICREWFIADDGSIHGKVDSELENITLQEALEKSGKTGLYVAEEGRVYESPMYLNWHRKYEQSLNDSMKETISDITPYKDNVDGNIANLRDTYLTAEREYVSELLKSESMRDLISEINAETPDKLFAMPQSIVDKVEMGLIPDEEMEKTEQKLTVLLAAIQDKVLLKDLVLVPSQGGRGIRH